MSQNMWILVGALGAEVVLLLIVLLLVSWWRNRTQRRNDARAMQALVARVKKAKGEREATIEKFLRENIGLRDEPLTQARVAMLRAELALLQRFVGLYRTRDAALAARFDADVVAALAPYHALQSAGAAAGGDATGSEEAADPAEVEFLRRENKRLTDELRVTMETMSRMLNEYSTMFAGGGPGDHAPIASLVGGAPGAAVGDDGRQPADEQVAGEVPEQPAEEVAEEVQVAADGERHAGGTTEASAQVSDTGDLAVESSATSDDADAAVDLVADAFDEVASPDAGSEGDAPVDVRAGAPDDEAVLEEGPAEVMAFDDAADLDVEMIAADDAEDLFDDQPAGANDDPMAAAPADNGTDDVESGAPVDGERPRQRQSGG